MTTASESMSAANVPDDLDIHEPPFVLNPYPTYEHLRSDCPVAHGSKYGGYWLLTRYEDVKQAVMDWRTYTSSVPAKNAIPTIIRRTEPLLPTELDPPLHSRYRALVNPVFSPERIEMLRPKVKTIATLLIDRLIEGKAGDLVADYALPLSVQTLAEFTGFPQEDTHRWVSWIQRMFNVHDREDGSRATQEITAYVDELIALRRKQPCGDFISLLLESQVDGHHLTDHELRSFSVGVFGAGYETTADAISVTLYYLAEHPEDRRLLAAKPQLIPTAVEEFMRFVSPIQIFGRTTTKDLGLYGNSIQKGEVVGMGFGSANHDPAVFPEPEHCVLDRTPNKHLAFGAGIHLCLGAPVARLEMVTTLEEFTKRIPDYLITGDVEWKTRGDRRGLAALPAVIMPYG